MTTTPSLARRGVLLNVTAFALLGASIATPAHAHDFRAGQLVIDHPYATPSLAGTPNGVAYLRGIRNRGAAPTGSWPPARRWPSVWSCTR